MSEYQFGEVEHAWLFFFSKNLLLTVRVVLFNGKIEEENVVAPKNSDLHIDVHLLLDTRSRHYDLI